MRTPFVTRKEYETKVTELEKQIQEAKFQVKGVEYNFYLAEKRFNELLISMQKGEKTINLTLSQGNPFYEELRKEFGA